MLAGNSLKMCVGVGFEISLTLVGNYHNTYTGFWHSLTNFSEDIIFVKMKLTLICVLLSIVILGSSFVDGQQGM